MKKYITLAALTLTVLVGCKKETIAPETNCTTVTAITPVYDKDKILVNYSMALADGSTINLSPTRVSRFIVGSQYCYY